jgi:hypothetical protein
MMREQFLNGLPTSCHNGQPSKPFETDEGRAVPQ